MTRAQPATGRPHAGNSGATPARFVPRYPSPAPKKSSGMSKDEKIIIGCVVGGVGIIIIIVACVGGLGRKKSGASAAADTMQQ